ncbi:MAG: NAD(P)/FAD-dependent oxidoreductase [Gammaproteobacteria bacterium]|nr:NAD(P)/FAD-dependent oxidoreductase [Gammaproteobacteria bacterium]
MKKKKLVLIGNGMAGARTLEELLKLAPDKYEITVFGAEPYGNYNRILLSPVLAGEKTIDEIMINNEQWYADNGITLLKGKKILHIDRLARKVFAEDGTVRDYDRIILATGSNPFVIPIPGVDLPGVVTFRDIHDVNAMLQASASHQNAVVIGGGLLGLEAAYGLLKQGMNVTVVHLLDTLMERQLDKPAADLLRLSLEARGLHLLIECQTEAILGEDHVRGLRFKPAPGSGPGDGSVINADLVVMAVGIRPNIELAQKARLHCERGVLVSDTMQTFDPRIYAVGECVQHRGMTYGLVAPLFEQARVCANHLAGIGYARYEGSVTATKLKVTGIDLFSAGEIDQENRYESIFLRDPGQGIYRKLVIAENRLRGAVLFGDTEASAWYTDLIRDGTDITPIREALMFGCEFLPATV